MSADQEATHQASTLRLASIGDLPFLIHGFIELSRLESADTGLTLAPDFAQQAENHLGTLLTHSEILILIAAQEKPVGFLIGSLQPCPNAFTLSTLYGFIQCVYVESSHAKRGVGSQLVDGFEKTVLELGADYIDVQHVVSNEAASLFWESLAYRPVATLRRKLTK